MGMTFNGQSRSYLTPLRGKNRPAWAPIEYELVEIPNRPGSYIKRKNVQVRRINVPIRIKGTDISDLQKIKEDLAAWLIQDKPKPLVFDDEPDRTYYAVVDGSFDPDEIVNVGKGTINFICPDPHKYGTEKYFTVSTSPINNEGTTDTTPIFTVTFTSTASELKITQQESGKYVRAIYNFVEGDQLVIDLNTRKVTINNNLRMTEYDWQSQPFELVPGLNNFAIFPSGVATTTIKFTPKWL